MRILFLGDVVGISGCSKIMNNLKAEIDKNKINFVIVNGEKNYKKGWKKNFSDLSIGLEIFNMFDIQNSITNTWVRDVYSKRQYSIPNYLTPRLLNLTIDMKL